MDLPGVIRNLIASYLQCYEANPLAHYLKCDLIPEPILHLISSPKYWLEERPNTDIVYIANYLSSSAEDLAIELIYSLKNYPVIRIISLQCHLCSKYNNLEICPDNKNRLSKIYSLTVKKIHTNRLPQGEEKNRGVGYFFCPCIMKHYDNSFGFEVNKREGILYITKSSLTNVIKQQREWILRSGKVVSPWKFPPS